MKAAVLGLVGIALGFGVISSLGRGVAETPSAFSGTFSLGDAIAASEVEGKSVVALVTADWCPPCQKLKAETLTDPRVVDLINAQTIPVYLEDGAATETIRGLGVTSYPTTLVIRDGEIVSSMSGYVGPADYVAFLRNAISPADE